MTKLTLRNGEKNTLNFEWPSQNKFDFERILKEPMEKFLAWTKAGYVEDIEFSEFDDEIVSLQSYIEDRYLHLRPDQSPDRIQTNKEEYSVDSIFNALFARIDNLVSMYAHQPDIKSFDETFVRVFHRTRLLAKWLVEQVGGEEELHDLLQFFLVYEGRYCDDINEVTDQITERLERIDGLMELVNIQTDEALLATAA